VLAEELIGVGGLDLPGPHPAEGKELLDRGELLTDAAVPDTAGRPGEQVLGEQLILKGSRILV